MARPRVHDDQTRRRLLEVSAGLLAAEGPHSLSTRRIAAAAQTTTAAIYSALGGKEELVLALCREGFRRLHEALAGVPQTQDPVADARALGHAYRQTAIANPGFFEVMFGRPIAGVERTALEDACGLDAFALLTAGASRCINAGRWVGTADEVALQLWAMVHGHVVLQLAGQFVGEVADASFEAALDLLERGLAAPSSAPA